MNWISPLDRTVAWLQSAGVAQRAGRTVPMPLRQKSKAPIFPHSKQEWGWDQVQAFVNSRPDHTSWGLLLDGLAVVDADDAAAVAWLEELAASGAVPELRDCPVQLTRKGRHYVFARPGWADAEGYYDGARQAPGGADGAEAPQVDLKTRCSTGTRGVLSVAPTPGKAWLQGRAPWDAGVVLHDAPRALLERVASPRGRPATLVGGRGRRRAASMASAASVAPPGTPSPTVGEGPLASRAEAERVLDEVRRLVGQLKPDRAGPYDTWIQVGLCLYNIATDLAGALPAALPLLCKAWDLFSKGGAKYIEGECERRWSAMEPRGPDEPALGVSRLRSWVCEDGGEWEPPSAPPSEIGSGLTSVSRARRSAKSQEEELSGYERVMIRMEEFAAERRLRKLVERRMVFEPVPGCPCAYRELMNFEKFVPHVLRGDPDYRASPRRAKDLDAYLVKYDERAFPALEVERRLISFANGVLVLWPADWAAGDALPTPVFMPYDGGDAPPVGLEGCVARHHIAAPYTGTADTPLMDSLLAQQFGMEDGRVETLYALTGRLFYPLKMLDNLQVMPLLIGTAGSGKSTILNVIAKGFSAHAFAEIDCSNEKTFGLSDKYDKEVLFVRDAPHNMQKVLPQEHFQKMVSAEAMQVSVKFGTAFHLEWRTPLIAAANQRFDYDDSAGQISRRVVPFHFDTIVAMAGGDTQLEARIVREELPALVARWVEAYLRLLEQAGPRSFWAVCPPALREAQEEAMSHGNLLHQYLRASPDDTRDMFDRAYVCHKKGAVTDYADLKEAFKRFLRIRHPHTRCELNTQQAAATCARLGYRMHHVNICKGCNGPSRVGCCADYSSNNRVKHWRIDDMIIERDDVPIPSLAESA